MKREEISNFIENNPITNSPFFVKITYKNKTIACGFFQPFKDFNKLKSKNQWRFILCRNAIAYKEDYDINKIPNPIHSIIIKGVDVASLCIARS